MNNKSLWDTGVKATTAGQVLVTLLKYKGPASCPQPSFSTHVNSPRSCPFIPQVPAQYCFLLSHPHLMTEMCPMLAHTVLAALFPRHGNHTELARSTGGTTWRKFLVGLSKRLHLSPHVETGVLKTNRVIRERHHLGLGHPKTGSGYRVMD